jgi:hypothetical protein
VVFNTVHCLTVGKTNGKIESFGRTKAFYFIMIAVKVCLFSFKNLIYVCLGFFVLFDPYRTVSVFVVAVVLVCVIWS